jgi:hypothetical protein
MREVALRFDVVGIEYLYEKDTHFLLIGFIIPQVTFAAWWNPRTWFVPRDTKNLHLEEVIKNDELVPSKEQSAVSTSSLWTSETKIVERVVTKTIPVDRVVEKIVIQSDQSGAIIKIANSSITFVHKPFSA